MNDIKDWTKPDEKGFINVPDHLDSLVNKIGFQMRFHTISGASEGQTICNIAFIAEKFFNELKSKS